MKILSLSLLLIVAIVLSSSAQTMGNYKVIKTFHITSTGGWDYISVGPGNNRIYVSHGTQVNILDATTGDSLGVIPNTAGVHGIAFNKKANKGYTSNGRANTISVFDLTTNKILSEIPDTTNPDWIMYDKSSDKIITCNGRSNDLSIVDATTEKLVARIPVGGKPETAVSNHTGNLYVNIEDKNEIAVIDMKTYKVTARYPLVGDSPTGLDIDNETHRLFAGCDGKLVILDAVSGKLVDTIKIGNGCDGVVFDKKSKQVFTSNGADATMSVIQEVSENKFTKLADVPTKKGARTLDIDKKTQTLYLPTADFEPLKAGEKRSKMIPGSFQIIVVSK